ncbi:MAG: hypothetical protein UV40_C0015G0007 [Parcubacteria group bacterium GW2011_GWA1_42_7]|nr:MAG: hypothetical protein UV34_C0002G0002 [Parcubacteria group bacterium GW2011_GWB1_42_6]KKS69753.1 MAG: hypothetical protein UV40_C0015G0007 [Parcubacteria group bacterium GW2011_GWA1_42_7]KKS92358.1 MAG: hypothetical protein UV67_C0005G0021 [Parcubacteria group bacterium GW2011_GWC1_43_12]
MRSALRISLWALIGFVAFSLFLSIFIPWKWAVLFLFMGGAIGGFEYLARKYNLAKGRKIFYPAAVILFIVLAIFSKYPWLKDGLEDSQIYYSLKTTDAVSKKYPSRLAVVSYKARMANLEAESRDMEKELKKIEKKRNKGKVLDPAEQVFLNSAPAKIKDMEQKMEEIKFIYADKEEKEKKPFSLSLPRFSFPQNFGWLQAVGWLIGLAFLISLILLIFKSTRPAGGKILAWAFVALAIIAVLGVAHELFIKDRSSSSAIAAYPQTALVDWSGARKYGPFPLKPGEILNTHISYNGGEPIRYIQNESKEFFILGSRVNTTVNSTLFEGVTMPPGGKVTLKGGSQSTEVTIYIK